MRFSELLADLADHGLPSRRIGATSTDPIVGDVTQRADGVPPAGIFVAIRGMRTDAHSLVPQAAAAGAVALLLEREVETPEGLPAAVVADTRVGLSLAAAALAGHPTEAMAMVGITGTDGKTTTSILTCEALRAAGAASGGMTSLDLRRLDAIEPNPTYRTTLEGPEIQRAMARLRDQGVEIAVLETTSHGIALGRVAGVAYDVAAYTNLTHEHLDFHGTMEEYRAVKLRLAAMAAAAPRKAGVPKAVVYNAADPAWAPLAGAPADVRVAYAVEGHSGDAGGLDRASATGGSGRGGCLRLRAAGLRPRIGGIDFTADVDGEPLPVSLPLMGRFNVANALCALGICHALGLPLDRAADGLRAPRGLRGRMQVLEAGQAFAVVVDYAHTPDALAQVLGELRPLTPGRLLVVFGAPGDRDAAKRPLMGEAVAGLADEFVITADDPRHERVEDISAAIATGAERAGRREGEDFRRIPDRREAIRAILDRARPGDTVLLAGKGHEDRMLIGAEELPWDEAEEARAALADLGRRP